MEKPILKRYTDGGPDHRTTYKSVKVAALAEFIALDLDMIVCARTAPCGSYVNPAERCMSLLNLALQNVALEAKEKYRGVFEIQKSGDKTSSGEIGLDIRTHASPKVGQDQVSGGVSILLLACRTRCISSMETLYN